MAEVRMPTQKRSIDKRNKIVEKGFELMCNNGYHKTNTSDIAEYAGVSTGIIYQYFNDKKEIFIEGVKKYSDGIMFPLLEIINNEEEKIDNIDEILNKLIDKFVSVHTVSKKAHEEMMAMSHLDDDVALRKEVAKKYIDGIKNPKITLPKVTDWKAHVFHIFTVLCEDRDELQKYLESKGIGTNIHYPIPPHKQECYKEWNDISLPITEKIHEQELSLPMSPCLTDEQIQYVIEALNAWE